MEKVVLSKKIQEAINGSKEAEEFLYSHYYECYYDLVEANQSIKNIELIYSESIRESIRKSIERKEKNIQINLLFYSLLFFLIIFIIYHISFKKSSMNTFKLITIWKF